VESSLTTNEDEPEPDGLGPTLPPPGEAPLTQGSLRFFRPGERERPQPAPGLSPGKQVGDFRLVSMLGQGGMGQVWEAEQVSLQRRVAVKFVRPERVTERQLELFAREARAGGRLSHPGIVTVYGHGQSDGLAWIAMEYVEGAWTLEDFLDEAARAGEVPAGYDRQTAELVAGIADAMHAAHEGGVIHRDLKPQNVLITAADRPKVTDFGLARITDEAALSVTGEFSGTYYYMSPEQVAARRAGIDRRTDVFSLGVVLYQLLALRRPFEGDTTHQVAAQILHKDPPDPRLTRSRVPRDLVVIAGKALEKDPDRRYQTMEELAADLRRHLANEPILARPPTRVERVVKWTRRNPAKSLAAGIVLVAFTIIALLLAENVRARQMLSHEKSNLARANDALRVKSEESEQLRLEALESAKRERQTADLATRNEKLARAEQERADREAYEARAKRDEVLRLSALQKLDDLTNEAESLWPAHPENVERIERWLEKAAALAAELPDHEAKLAELRARAQPWTAEEQAEFRATHPRLKDLERLARERTFLEARLAVLEGGDPGPEPTAAEVGVDLAALPAEASGLNSLAWALVDPERTSFGDERRGLVLARRAAELAGEAERAGILDTLAWALFALGRFEDAAVESQRALEEASEDEKSDFEGHLARLHAALDAELAPEAAAKARERLAELEAQRAAVEEELSARSEWTFDDDQDRWWHNQLEKLVEGIRSFADEESGLFSEGTSEEHGWGVKRRLATAMALRDGFAPDGAQARAWARALPEIDAAYPGLALAPQLGLVPLGPDPDSKLWEFAHLETGEPAVRGADGKLVLTEETGLVFVLLPGGTFLMGAQPSDPSGPNHDPQAADYEGPAHEVTLSPFFLSKYEMTQGQWQRFVGTNPSYYRPGSAYGGKPTTRVDPVEQVSWLDCVDVMGRLGLSLPSEAQWEYGARAGTTTVWWTGNERETLLGAANLADQAAARAGAAWQDIQDWPELDDGYVVHAPVNEFRPNAFGLHNVHGNVWEWCLDGHDGSSYEKAATKDPVSPPGGSPSRVSRGGGFRFAAVLARSALRLRYSPSFASSSLGVRPARTIAP
jgi:serine/threonine protein kinase/formylglycine-generating enzyme required for sulfatase activity